VVFEVIYSFVSPPLTSSPPSFFLSDVLLRVVELSLSGFVTKSFRSASSFFFNVRLLLFSCLSFTLFVCFSSSSPKFSCVSIRNEVRLSHPALPQFPSLAYHPFSLDDVHALIDPFFSVVPHDCLRPPPLFRSDPIHVLSPLIGL